MRSKGISTITLAVFAILALPGVRAADVLVVDQLNNDALNAYAGSHTLNLTVVDTNQWSGMTTAAYAAYDLVWLGANTSGPPGHYGSIQGNMTEWGPAITGSVFMTGSDLATHSTRTEVSIMVTDVVDWLLRSPGTSLYVESDRGTRGMDFVPWTVTGCATRDCFQQDIVSRASPVHTALIRMGSAMLSNWGYSTYSQFFTLPEDWEAVAVGPGSEIVSIATPTCRLCGDCSRDSIGPNILDSLKAAQFAAGLGSPNLRDKVCCDVDLNGLVNILDALRIAQYSVGLSVTLSCV